MRVGDHPEAGVRPSLPSVVGRHVAYRLYRRWAGRRGLSVDPTYPEFADSLALWLTRALPAPVVARLGAAGVTRLAESVARTGRVAGRVAVGAARRARRLVARPAVPGGLTDAEAAHFVAGAPAEAHPIRIGPHVVFLGHERRDGALRFYFRRGEADTPLGPNHRFFVTLIPDDPAVLPPHLRAFGFFAFDHRPAVPFDRWPLDRVFVTSVPIAGVPAGAYTLRVGVQETTTWKALPADGAGNGVIELGTIDQGAGRREAGGRRVRVHWLVPYPIPGSGGHRTILDHVRHLASRGYESVLYVQPADPHTPGSRPQSARELEERLDTLFFPTGARVVAGWDRLEPSDVLFATAWDTAFAVRGTLSTRCRAYFVQDFEAWFCPMGDGYLNAEQTYRFGFECITIGRWLTHLITTRYGGSANAIDFTVDDTTYHPAPEPHRGSLAVAFLHQPEKPRRCPLIGTAALAQLKQLCPEVTIYLYGSTASTAHLSFPHINLGLLSPRGCADLYRRVQVGLCLSSSNPSRIPFEMMAAGCAVVDLDRENNGCDYDPGAICLAEPSPEALARAMAALLTDREARERQVAAALEMMRGRPNALAYRQFEALVAALHERGSVRGVDTAAGAANGPPVRATGAHGGRA